MLIHSSSILVVKILQTQQGILLGVEKG